MVAENNLLLADMRKAVKDYFGEFITSIDNKFHVYEDDDKAFEDAKAELKAEIKRLYVGLERMDSVETRERADNIKNRMVDIAEKDVARAFGKVISTYMEMVAHYAFGV